MEVVMKMRLAMMLCVLLACAAGDALVAKGYRNASALWIFRELSCALFRGNDVWKQKYTRQRVSDNVNLLTAGSSTTGTFTPYHAVDYLLTVRFFRTPSLIDGVGAQRLREALTALENGRWTLRAEIRDPNGMLVTSFSAARKDMYNLNDDIDWCAFIELELGRIDIPRELVGQSLVVKVWCTESASDNLLKIMEEYTLPVDLCCVLPFSPT